MTQNEIILEHMQKFGKITPLEAMSEYGIMRLASRITDLKHMGYKIKKETACSKNRYGDKVHYASYSLGENEDVL